MSYPSARRRMLRVAVALLAMVALAVGGSLVWFSSWSRSLRSADAARAAADWKQALDQYTAAEARFTASPLAQRLFQAQYRATLANKLEAQYRLGNLDAVIEAGDAVPATPSSHFWVGAALFEKSRVEENADARLALLGRASDEFKAALESESSDWDTLYNYELTKRLFDELRKKPQTPPKQMLQLLRPQPKEGAKPEKKAG